MLKRKIAHVCACGVALWMFSDNFALADEVYAKIRGTVADATGAVIPNVKITATNVGTGVSKTVTSGSDGSYEFLQIPAPATYKVSAQQQGFRSFEATGIQLNLNQVYVLNISLQVGAVTQQVTIEASPAQVETTSMQLGNHITARDVVELPLLGRNWINLQQTIPGAVAASDRFGNFATNGTRSQFNSYMINGTDANDLPLNTPIFIPSPDAIAEVHIITNTINPEYGRDSGAVLNAVTKSGTNSLHGDGFEFYRDTFLNARNFYKPKPQIFHQNLFGATVGGPAWKDHTFFFFSYQGNRNVQPQAGGTVTVFTQDQRNGIFGAGAIANCTIDTSKGQTVAKNCQTSPFAMVGDANSSCPAGGPACPARTPYGNAFDISTGTPTLIANDLFTSGSIP